MEVERVTTQTLRDDDDLDVDEEANDIDPTIPEDMGYDEVRRSLQKFERLLQRRTRRHGNDAALVADRTELIAGQQAELVSLQSIADATLVEMHSLESANA